jgi:hypothetical protein
LLYPLSYGRVDIDLLGFGRIISLTGKSGRPMNYH